MKREIKFRAKRKDNGEWLYWDILVGFSNPTDIIDVNTIGQFTGMHDKNLDEIWEDDLVNDGAIIVFIGGRFLCVYKNGKSEDLIGYEDVVIGNIFDNKNLINKRND
jgi:hypothetical protein